MLFVVSSVLALKSSSSFNAVIWFGIVGFMASAIMFLAGAPEVALTQITVGVVLVVLVYMMAIRKQRRVRLGYIRRHLMIEESAEGLTGVEWDLLSKIDEKEGYDVDAAVFDDLKSAVKALKTGHVDVVCGGITDDSVTQEEGIIVVPYLTSSKYEFLGEIVDYLKMKELAQKNPSIKAVPVTETDFVFLLSESSKDIRAFFAEDLRILAETGELEKVVSKYL